MKTWVRILIGTELTEGGIPLGSGLYFLDLGPLAFSFQIEAPVPVGGLKNLWFSGYESSKEVNLTRAILGLFVCKGLRVQIHCTRFSCQYWRGRHGSDVYLYRASLFFWVAAQHWHLLSSPALQHKIVKQFSIKMWDSSISSRSISVTISRSNYFLQFFFVTKTNFNRSNIRTNVTKKVIALLIYVLYCKLYGKVDMSEKKHLPLLFKLST
jgi:hypothetical protein